MRSVPGVPIRDVFKSRIVIFGFGARIRYRPTIAKDRTEVCGILLALSFLSLALS